MEVGRTSARGGSRNSIGRRIPLEGLPQRYFDPLKKLSVITKCRNLCRVQLTGFRLILTSGSNIYSDSPLSSSNTSSRRLCILKEYTNIILTPKLPIEQSYHAIHILLPFIL